MPQPVCMCGSPLPALVTMPSTKSAGAAGSGTVSGPTPEEAGSLLELSRGGQAPVALPNGERRAFLQDGDAVVLRGACEAPGRVRIGFGECRGLVLPAIAWPRAADEGSGHA